LITRLDTTGGDLHSFAVELWHGLDVFVYGNVFNKMDDSVGDLSWIPCEY